MYLLLMARMFRNNGRAYVVYKYVFRLVTGIRYTTERF